PPPDPHTRPLPDALPISDSPAARAALAARAAVGGGADRRATDRRATDPARGTRGQEDCAELAHVVVGRIGAPSVAPDSVSEGARDRKSTRLNSSHVKIS